MRWILTENADKRRGTLFDTSIFKFYELTLEANQQTCVSVGHKNFMGTEAVNFWRNLAMTVEFSSAVGLDATAEHEVNSGIAKAMKKAVEYE